MKVHIATTKTAVRYAETDQMGVVYHANYLVWLELGRTALVESLGYSYATMEEEGVVSPVLEVQIKYHKPLRYGEEATIKTWVKKYDGLRVVYGYEILNPQGVLCVTATTVNVCVDKQTFRPIAIKRRFPRWHQAYEKAKKV